MEVEENLYNFLKEEGFFGSSLPDYKEQNERPSLRYLLVHVTYNCNLSCGHCYVEKEKKFMDLKTFRSVAKSFYEIGGLKLMITGGEPLTHPQIFDILEEARKYPYRVVLLTNGTLIDEDVAKKLRLVDEVQISLDGLEGHEKLRGVSYKEVLERVKLAALYTDVSIATMVTKYNLDEFEKLRDLITSLGVKNWIVDFPSCSEDVVPGFDKASLISLGFGEGHEAAEGYLCGTHLASITPEGGVTKCGFFDDVVGSAYDLREAWKELRKKYIWTISKLKCECEFLEECRGGCRYRALLYAGDLFGEDPVMCSLFKSVSP